MVLLAVPTPLSDGSPDLRPVRAATQALAQVLRPGTLVVLESTTWPGTTEEVLLPLLEPGRPASPPPGAPRLATADA